MGPKALDPEEVLARNPQIDRRQLDEFRELLRRLQEQGIQRKDYELAPPFGGARVTVRDQGGTRIRLRSVAYDDQQ